MLWVFFDSAALAACIIGGGYMLFQSPAARERYGRIIVTVSLMAFLLFVTAPMVVSCHTSAPRAMAMD